MLMVITLAFPLSPDSLLLLDNIYLYSILQKRLLRKISSCHIISIIWSSASMFIRIAYTEFFNLQYKKEYKTHTPYTLCFYELKLHIIQACCSSFKITDCNSFSTPSIFMASSALRLLNCIRFCTY